MHGPGSNADNAALPEIAGYRLRKVINHGGMSTVYLGEQLALSREVAIKVMLPVALADEVSRRRFENEARTIARLEHPNIVGIHEVGRTRDGLPYYAMPYLPRGHLGQRDLSRDEPRAIEIALTLLSALDYAHAHGVVHRDVKAENVLFDDSERPLLADFGIALRRGFGPRVTAAGLAVGSTAYMAPEQARGEDVDGRADLYSLGVLFWEMLAGRLPYQAGDALSMAVMHAQDPIPRLPPHLRHWQRFMHRALAKSPEQRFQSAKEMAAAIERVRDRRPWSGALEAARRWLPDRRWAKPLWAGLGAAAIALVAVAFGVGRDAAGDGFFRAPPAPANTAAPAAGAGADPTDAMLQPLPEAPVQNALVEAKRLIAEGRLTGPGGDNAYDRVLLAWHDDSANPELGAVVDALTGALAEQVGRHLREGRDQRARELLVHTTALGQQTGTADSPAQRRLRELAAEALQRRVDAARERRDPAEAEKAAALAREFGLPQATAARLAAQARAIPAGASARALGGADLAGTHSNARASVALSARPVSRREYARFAAAHGRKPALCRERASLLRVLDPRDWQSPGFPQGEDEPVVCVSAEDAQAYAQWYSTQTGRDYRLPSLEEARQLPAETGARALSMWLRDCGRDCRQRQVVGASWRSRQAARALAAGRGYDDVGFRLIRER